MEPQVCEPGGASSQSPSCEATGALSLLLLTPKAPLAPRATSNTVAAGTVAPPISMHLSSATVSAEALDVLACVPSYLLPTAARIW